ncbi:MAG: hypothetical protein GX785_03175 [Armatimonadetes bacterium]|jgi:hypothetical protein|nr:hypothetical protein [Armatimonadota bacterium]HOM83233.1 beta-galactosidase [Armatimonadota bacterium]HPO71765.1 beta-galactosidase [Armatimonadota bacterium]
MKRLLAPLLMLLFATTGAQPQLEDRDATVTVHPPKTRQIQKGRNVTQDVTLATASASYTLRYDIVERSDDPQKIHFAKWAPTLGFTPLGLIGPSECLWYNQGFFAWTFDGHNINDTRARFRVVRQHGQDAMVEYVWDTPKVTATIRFAVTAGSDKLLFVGSYQPKTEIKEARLRLLSYPATFAKPWQRSVTTATRTLTTGKSVPLDLSKERWVLLEDTLQGRMGDGSAGLILGDTTAFSRVTLDDIGGYAEYVNLTLAPGRRDFALALYAFPSIPDPEETRAYFRRSADQECEALARIAKADPEKPLPMMPTDRERMKLIARKDEEMLRRPQEIWRPDPTPLGFPWASQLPGEPVRVALLTPRWRAYDTMELARRLEMDVKHVYFDSANALVDTERYPYRAQTGVGPLGAGVVERLATRACTDPTREVIFVAGLNADAIPARVRDTIVEQVRAGKGLFLTGDARAIAAWPKELVATPDEALTAQLLEGFPWEQFHGLGKGERGRLSDKPPFQAYRFGNGRVIVFTARFGSYSCLVPLNSAIEGLDGATDRILAWHARAMLLAASRPARAQVALQAPQSKPAAGAPFALPAQVKGEGVADLLVRVQDDHDVVVYQGTQKPADGKAQLSLPALPAGRRYFVDVAARNAQRECLGFGCALVEVTGGPEIREIALNPSVRVHPEAVPMVSLTSGGVLACEATVGSLPAGQAASMRWEVRDAFDRLVARAVSPVGANGKAQAQLRLPPAVTVYHQLDSTLLVGERVLAIRSERFTVPVPYPYDDFTVLLWSYPGGDPVIRKTNRASFDLGTEMMDLCHMRGYTDAGAAREYALAARSGLRLVPYVTRIAGEGGEGNVLKPGLFDTKFLERESASIQIATRQAVPYRPAAYTLGDENYLCRSTVEVCAAPETMAEFRKWLQARYGTIEALNAAWKTRYTGFDAIRAPMWFAEAAKQKESFAAWFDHRAFMDEAFALAHERFAEVVRKEDPGAKVGWDGFLGYHWQSGYDFHRLSQNLDLNQVYTTYFPQGELVRSFARPGALTGEWSNIVADKEDGFSAVAWHHLFKGHNSSWWWTLWGCDYTPFNPDTSVAAMGEWFFRSVDEIRAGPGRLLVGAKRDDSRIGVWYSHTDYYAARLAEELVPNAPFAGAGWLDDHRGLLQAIEDLGCQYRYVAAAEVEADPKVLSQFKVLFLPLATCLSDKQVAAIRDWVAAGGTLVADGRAGILTSNGVIRQSRPFDDLFGVRSPAGLAAFTRKPVESSIPMLADETLKVSIMEPDVRLAGGHAEFSSGETPIIVSHTFGKGRTLLVNVPFQTYRAVRSTSHADQALEVLGNAIATAGVQPYARVWTASGRAQCIEQSLFVDGGLKYLALEQDILEPGQPAQEATLTLPQPAFVYDVREGKPMGQGRTSSWRVKISRGRPLLYALLPYQVREVRAQAPATATAGETVTVRASVAASEGTPGRHVVHVSVFAPGAQKPHRLYSTNIECPNGQGTAVIPFALNDTPGEWRLEFKDTASGVKATRTVRVSAARGR